MTFDELFDSLPINGWLTKEEARLLLDTAGSCQGPILEVGSYYGRSAVLLASLGREVYCVDPFSDFDSDDLSGNYIYSMFVKNVFHERCLMNVHLHRRKVEDWFPLIPNFGFAYLDGDHTYEGTLTQIDRAMAAGARTFCLHDYAQSGGGLNITKAIEKRQLEVVRVVERMCHCRVGGAS